MTTIDLSTFQIEKGTNFTEYEPPVPAPDFPIEIYSLNDFDVVSSVGGRNLALNSNEGWTSNGYRIFTGELSEDWVVGETYTVTIKGTVNEGQTFGLWRDGGSIALHKNFVPNEDKTIWKVTAIAPETTRSEKNKFSVYNVANARAEESHVEWIKIEKGSTATPWTPALEDITSDTDHPLIDKVNLSLSEPLRSVGDVHDRLFRDVNDGLWKIERNVGEKTFNNSSGWGHHVYSDTEKDNYETRPVTTSFGRYRQVVSDRFIGSLNRNIPINNISMSSNGYLNFAVEKGMINNLSEWFSQNPFTVLYEEVPTTETLDQELQDKLNTLKSFMGSNYVYTVQNTDNPHKEQLKPTLHATFNSKDYLKETRTVNNLLIWARELTDEELIHHNKLFLNRFNLPSDRIVGEPVEQTLNFLHGGMVGHSLEQNYTINI